MPHIGFCPRFDIGTFSKGRNPHVKHSVKPLILLIIIVLLSTVSTKQAKAQKINELVYDSLILSKPELFSGSVGAVEGVITQGLKQNLRLDTAQKLVATLTPDVSYSRSTRGTFQRTLEIKVSYSDSLLGEAQFSFSDQVPRAELRRIRKTKHKELRGENPQRFSRIVLPLTTIVTGTVAVISLFYIRSN
jgi:hypothetical protein